MLLLFSVRKLTDHLLGKELFTRITQDDPHFSGLSDETL